MIWFVTQFGRLLLELEALIRSWGEFNVTSKQTQMTFWLETVSVISFQPCQEKDELRQFNKVWIQWPYQQQDLYFFMKMFWSYHAIKSFREQLKIVYSRWPEDQWNIVGRVSLTYAEEELIKRSWNLMAAWKCWLRWFVDPIKPSSKMGAQ